MNKNQYLANQDVASFIMWFQQYMTADVSHNYFNAKQNLEYTFTSLYGAFEKYDWPFNVAYPSDEQPIKGSTFEDSSAVLNKLKDELRTALKQSNEQQLIEWACCVMKWGGVTNHNNKWLNNINNDVLAQIAMVKAMIEANDDNELTNEITRFNAGMTKVYSLLIDGFIIYDSRVAAALGWFIRKWCVETNRATIPQALAFPWMPAKENKNTLNPKNRNPSTGNLTFPSMGTNHKKYATWNLRASWLLSASLQGSPNTTFNNDLRKLESALFMWGYDLGQ